MSRGHARCGPWLLLQALMSSRADAWSARPPMYHIDAGDGAQHKSLYPKAGPVEVLIGDAAWNMIQQDHNTVWLVEFYDTGCPHCWYFSGIYPTVARAIKSQTVRVAAFNCIDPSNANACADVMMFPTLRAFNLQAPGDPKREINVHKGNDIDQNLTPQAIAAKLNADSNARVPIVHPEVFHSTSTAGHLVDPRGPPGKDGWPNEPYGSVPTRFHDAHIGMVRLLMDGYSSSAKYQAALDVVQFIGTAYAKDEEKVFHDLLTKLQAQPNLEPPQFRALMHDWVQQFKDQYFFCKTKTCSVWQLFHTISTLIAIHYAPIEVAEALPKYRFMVDNFMDCEVCRAHFLTSYDSCLFGRCAVLGNPDKDVQAKALVLWLWRTHNAVNQRVISENPPKDGQAIDRRWPAYHECVGCWNVRVVNGEPADLLTYHGQKNNEQPVYGVFNEDKVFGFILKSYLGQDEDSSERLFEAIPSLRQHSEAAHPPPAVSFTGGTQVVLTFSCAIAAVATLFAVLRFGHSLTKRSPAVTGESELLETLETVE